MPIEEPDKETLMLEAIDEAEAALKGQRRVLKEYEAEVRRKSDEYAILNRGKKRRRNLWYREEYKLRRCSVTPSMPHPLPPGSEGL